MSQESSVDIFTMLSTNASHTVNKPNSVCTGNTDKNNLALTLSSMNSKITSYNSDEEVTFSEDKLNESVTCADSGSLKSNNLTELVETDKTCCVPTVSSTNLQDKDLTVTSDNFSRKDTKSNSENVGLDRLAVRKRSHVCIRCGQRFITRLQLVRHAKVHVKVPKISDRVADRPPRKFSCDICKRLFNKRSTARSHMRVHSEDKPYKCSTCDMTFRSGCNLKRHSYQHSGNKPYLCEQCGRSFIQKQLLTTHVEHHHTEWICPLCQKRFKKTSLLTQHSMLEHEGKVDIMSVQRLVCGAKSEDAAMLWLLCETCGKGFTNAATLRKHYLLHARYKMRHSGEKLPVENRENWCELCQREFSSRFALRIHLQQHSSDRPFACEECKKTFVSEERLKVHIINCHNSELQTRLNGQLKAFKCPVCEKTFRSAGYLQVHSVVHTGLQPFACTECDKRFAFEGCLKTHMRIHTGEKPYSCTLCDKKFRQPGHLKNHINGHMGVRPYACRMCSKAYKNNLDLRYHYERFHQLNIKVEKTNVRPTYIIEIPQSDATEALN